jgi:hypothetical protein
LDNTATENYAVITTARKQSFNIDVANLAGRRFWVGAHLCSYVDGVEEFLEKNAYIFSPRMKSESVEPFVYLERFFGDNYRAHLRVISPRERVEWGGRRMMCWSDEKDGTAKCPTAKSSEAKEGEDEERDEEEERGREEEKGDLFAEQTAGSGATGLSALELEIYKEHLDDVARRSGCVAAEMRMKVVDDYLKFGDEAEALYVAGLAKLVEMARVKNEGKVSFGMKRLLMKLAYWAALEGVVIA